MDETVQLGKGGRLVIPARLRRALGILPGDRLMLRVEEGKLVLAPAGQAIQEAQARVRRYVPAGTRLSDTLLADRRRESEHE